MQRMNEILANMAVPTATAATAIAANSAPICSHCRGVGFLRMDVPVGHARFGQLIPCSCRQTAPVAVTTPPQPALMALADQTFATFDPAIPGTAEAFRACREYAETPTGWLFLLGGFGAGKTHLAASIGHQTRARGIPTYFAVAPDLLDYLRSTYAPNSPVSYDEIFEQMRQVPLLIVDDLGAEAATPWAGEKLYQLFNNRYIYRLPTVVTTNRDLGILDGRLASRLSDVALCRQVRMTAGDYRQRSYNKI